MNWYDTIYDEDYYRRKAEREEREEMEDQDKAEDARQDGEDE